MNQMATPILELVLLCFFLIILAFFVLFILKKTKIGFNVKNTIKELDRFYYSPKGFISIVKIGEEILLIGVTDANINLVKKIDDKESVDTILLNYQKSNTGMQFSELFNGDSLSIQNIKNRLRQMRNNKNEED